MSKQKAHISESKKKEVEHAKKLMQEHKVVLIADLTSLPSAQLQSIKTKLKKNLTIRVIKKRLIRIAIEQLRDKKDLTKLQPHLDKCMPALLVTNEDPFSIYKSIKRSKSYIAAKPGQIAPSDLFVEPGPTPFPPGPIIGELGQAGIIAAVEGGKVVIKRRTVLAKEGQEISTKAAGILAKLGVEPIQIGLNVVAAIDDGVIYERGVLDVDEVEYLNNLRQAHFEAVSLAVGVSYITKESIKVLLGKAQREMLAISKNINLYLIKENQKSEYIGEEEIETGEVKNKPPEQKSQSIYSKEAEQKAQEVLNKLKEEDIRKKTQRK